jgi:hypothetical protein
MPKLKEDYLKKRYTCQYCGKSFPTKQGLSGHIQFKHQKKWIKEPDLPPYTEIVSEFMEIEKHYGLLTVTSNDILDMMKYWLEFKLLCSKVFKIELNQQDLKHYVIASLVQIHQNQRLMK